jgi:hypothetical protein
MEFYFYAVFGIQVMVLVALEFGRSGKDRISTSPAFNAFKNNYLVVYSLMMGNAFLLFLLARTLHLHCSVFPFLRG